MVYSLLGEILEVEPLTASLELTSNYENSQLELLDRCSMPRTSIL
jgi:hypothetical protein